MILREGGAEVKWCWKGDGVVMDAGCCVPGVPPVHAQLLLRCETVLQAEEIAWLRTALAASLCAGAEASARVRQWEDLGFT